MHSGAHAEGPGDARSRPAVGAPKRWDAGVAQSAAPGEAVSGDAACVLEVDDALLVCVADGLGHGAAARAAADAFLAVVQRQPRLALPQILSAGSQALWGTRGAAATLLRLGRDGIVEVAGIGNVAVCAWTQQPFLALPTPGILGGRHPSARAFKGYVAAGDVLVVCSDGVSRAFLAPPARHLAAAEVAEALLQMARTAQDDATLVAVRVLA